MKWILKCPMPDWAGYPLTEKRGWTKIMILKGLYRYSIWAMSILLVSTFAMAQEVILNQSENDNSSKLVLTDENTAFKSITEAPVVYVFTAVGYDSHAELNWEHPEAGL